MPFDMTMPPGYASCADAWGRLRDAHDALAAQIAGLHDDLDIEVVTLGGTVLGSFKAAEFKYKFPRLNWSLVNAVPDNGGVGATESLPRNMGAHYDRWNGADTRILPNGLLGYDVWLAAGRNYLVLHETAHTTVLGLRMTQDCWDEHCDHEHGIPYGIASAAWTKNERFANDIALAVARTIGAEVLGQPTAGYDVMAAVLPKAARSARHPRNAAEIPLDLLDLSSSRSPVRKPRQRKKAAAKKPVRTASKSLRKAGRKVAKKTPPATRKARRNLAKRAAPKKKTAHRRGR